MNTLIYSIMHFLADGLATLTLVGKMDGSSMKLWVIPVYLVITYGFQLPIAVAMDFFAENRTWKSRQRYYSCLTLAAVVLILIGILFSPLIMGVGNALFHVSGAAGTACEARRHNWKGWPYALYAAPGAMGIYIGKAFAMSRLGDYDGGKEIDIMILAAAFLLVICGMMPEIYRWFIKRLYTGRKTRKNPGSPLPDPDMDFSGTPLAWLCCFIAMILLTGMGTLMDFSWRKGVTLGILSIAGTVSGQIMGGLSIARFGTMKTLFYSLTISSVLYNFADQPLMGLLAMTIMSMAIPVMIVVMTDIFSKTPGVAFGVLSLALLVGRAPQWMVDIFSLPTFPYNAGLTGAVGTLIILTIMLVPVWQTEEE